MINRNKCDISHELYCHLSISLSLCMGLVIMHTIEGTNTSTNINGKLAALHDHPANQVTLHPITGMTLIFIVPNLRTTL